MPSCASASGRSCCRSTRHDPEPVERAAYDAAYKGVTDVLTLYLWRKPAFYLTRWAARGGPDAQHRHRWSARCCACSPSSCSGAGDYWLGVLSGFVFMVLDTVDGKLARCTGASSKWGNVFDHGIDLIHPPFWWWAWEHGLAAYGRPLEPVYATMVLWAIVVGYVAQRVIEGIFMRRFGGMHIHVWRPIDSQFRLITARRNPNMVILVAALLFGRPDIGLGAGRACGRIVSLIFHAVRLAQASERRRAGGRSSPGSKRERWTAIVLAGSRPGRDAFARAIGTDLKALIPVGGEPMVRGRCARCSHSTEVGDIVVLTQQPERIAAGPSRRPARAASEPRAATIAATIERLRRSCDALAAAGHDRRPCAARPRR